MGVEKAELQFEIDKEMVKEHLISLTEFKSPGPDELHPRVIKELAETLRTTVYSLCGIMEDG